MDKANRTRRQFFSSSVGNWIEALHQKYSPEIQNDYTQYLVSFFQFGGTLLYRTLVKILKLSLSETDAYKHFFVIVF